MVERNVHNYFVNILARGGLLQVFMFLFLYLSIIKFYQSTMIINFMLLIPVLILSSLDVTMEGSISIYIFYLPRILFKRRNMSKTAFITGITGQDGYYLSKFLLENEYTVHGTIRRSSSINTVRIDDLISEYKPKQQLTLHYSDLLDSASIFNLINYVEPDEVYNLAAQSHVAVSFQNPIFTTQVGTLGSTSILEAIRRTDKNIKYYQASSSEMYGGASKEMLSETSLFDPKSPYAASKVFAHNMTKLYRESYNLFCTNGILFNHESPLRGETFVTRKITKAVGRIYHNLQKKLTLGNLEASRDWVLLVIIQKNVEDVATQ